MSEKLMSEKLVSERIYNVLFLCTGNSARSILAEAILRKDGHRHFRAFSAGSQAKGAVNPFAIKVLRRLDYPTDDLRSKSWEEFAAPTPAPHATAPKDARTWYFAAPRALSQCRRPRAPPARASRAAGTHPAGSIGQALPAPE